MRCYPSHPSLSRTKKYKHECPVITAGSGSAGSHGSREWERWEPRQQGPNGDGTRCKSLRRAGLICGRFGPPVLYTCFVCSFHLCACCRPPRPSPSALMCFAVSRAGAPRHGPFQSTPAHGCCTHGSDVLLSRCSSCAGSVNHSGKRCRSTRPCGAATVLVIIVVVVVATDAAYITASDVERAWRIL